MIKLIDTNLSLQVDNRIIDHQSRIIEVDSWDAIINEIKEGKSVYRDGTMIGLTLPKGARIENLEYDDFHLSCDVYDKLNKKTKKLIYLIKE